jgi:hypothetical protein
MIRLSEYGFSRGQSVRYPLPETGLKKAFPDSRPKKKSTQLNHLSKNVSDIS